jgi:hypothetical protein
MSDLPDADLRSRLSSLSAAGLEFLVRCSAALEGLGVERLSFYHKDSDYYWSKMPQDLRDKAHGVVTELIQLGQKTALACKNSLLASEADMRDLAVEVKTMRAAIRLRQYSYNEPEEVYDDRGDKVLGFRPESQGEGRPLWPVESARIWKRSSAAIGRILEIVDQGAFGLIEAGAPVTSGVSRYKPNSAFIMMWMDPAQPELADVRDAVGDIFARFGIRALRADEIEHDGVITQRIVDEIRTSEFLFADLTGARPNVYYEVGYAHALGKRVILFRKKGTGLHFDLAGYNCPEYENLRDLREKLVKRLENITNKQLPAGDKKP